MSTGRPEHACTACGGRLAGWRRLDEVELLRCLDCGSVAVVGAPADDSSYLDPAQRRLRHLVGVVRAVTERDCVRLVGKLAPGSDVLEVGAGEGALATRLARAGHRVTALEPYRSAVGVEEAGGRVLRTTIEGAELPTAAFDVAILWHVLEHLGDPTGALVRVREWLRPSGLLVAAVPNLESLQATLGGTRWFHLDPVRHAILFTPAGLAALLDRSGFDVLTSQTLMADQTLHGMWMTMLNRLTRAPSALRRFVRQEELKPSRTDLAITAVAALPLLPAAVVSELAAGLVGRGGALVVKARVRA